MRTPPLPNPLGYFVPNFVQPLLRKFNITIWLTKTNQTIFVKKNNYDFRSTWNPNFDIVFHNCCVWCCLSLSNLDGNYLFPSTSSSSLNLVSFCCSVVAILCVFRFYIFRIHIGYKWMEWTHRQHILFLGSKICEKQKKTLFVNPPQIQCPHIYLRVCVFCIHFFK